MGVKVTINSDDPPMFNTTLIDEYKTIVNSFNYTIKIYIISMLML